MATNREKSSSSVFLDISSAQHALDKLNEKIAAYDRQLAKTNLTQRELASLQKSRADAAQKAAGVQQQIEKGLGATLVQQKRYVQDLTKEISNLAQGTQEWVEKQKQLQQANQTLAEMKARLSGVEQEQAKVAKTSGVMASFFGNLLANVAVRAAGAVKNFFTDLFSEAINAERQTSRLKSTLDNLGRTDVFDRLIGKADEMARKFRFLDNDDIVGVFEKLIDFGKFTERQINDLLPVIIDFAAKTNKSIGDATESLLNSLNGKLAPELKRMNIRFKEGSTEAEKLAVIMTELKGKVDGAGEAFQNSADGGIAVMKQEMANLKEEIGTGLLPMLNRLLRFSLDALNNLKSFFNALSAEFNGKNAFVQIAVDEVASNPELRQASEDLKDQVIGSFTAAQKQIEEQLGRSLNLANKTDAAMLKKSQDLRLKGIEDKLAADTKTLEGLYQTTGRQAQLEARSLKISIDARTNALRELKTLTSGSTGTLGTSGPDPADEAAAKKLQERLKKEAEERKKLLEDLDKIRRSLAGANLNDLDRELAELDQKYAELRERANGNANDIKNIQELFLQERIQLIAFYSRKEVEEWRKAQTAVTKEQSDRFKQNIKALTDTLKAESDALLANAATRDTDRNRGRLAQRELEVLQTRGRKKLQAELALLEEQKRQELNMKELTEAEKALIEEKYDQEADEKRRENLSKTLGQVLEYAQQVVNIIQTANQAQADRENRELERQLRSNDRQKSAYQRLLNNKLISQQEYNRRVAQLDADAEKKKEDIDRKQFERNKRLQIVQALINGAQAVTKALAEYAFPANLVPIAFAVGTTIAQVATISKSKYERGGFLPEGPSHKDNGIKLVDGRTGKIRGEIEGGEPILSRKTYQNNKPVVDALLRSSMYGNGQAISPFWKNRPYKTLDYAGMSRTIQTVRHFENGGTLPLASSAGNNSNDQVQTISLPPGLELLPEVISALVQELAKPKKSYVVYSDIEAAGDKLDKIKDDAIFK